jgi:cellulose synthase operon protein C
MKSWARHFLLGLLLATAIPSAGLQAAQSAEQILLDKASYWRLRDRPDLAVEALQKLLSINPNQPDGLYQYGIIQVQQGKIEEAKGYLARLQKAAPGSPRATELENAIRAGQVSPSELTEARRLAQSGQFSQAAQKYQQTFKGAPPPTFGIEYYMTLAGTQQGWDEAHKGLEALVQNSPNDSKAKLALAEVETYHPETRARGMRSLAQLSDDPIAGGAAAQAWKKSTAWLGGSAEDRQAFNQYLAKFPQDTEVRQHMVDAEKPGAPTGPTTSPGYSDLNRGNLAAAERQFAAQLQAHPDDADALAGLGLVRLRQQRFGEARDLLGRAMRAAPARRGQWATAYDSAELWGAINEGKAAAAAGNNARAETAYRRVLAGHPDNATAIVGLYTALIAQGKTAEAQGLAEKIATLAPSQLAGLNRARSDLLRAEAKNLDAAGNFAAAQAKYQEAIAVDPNNAWARLDNARLLVRQGDSAQAFAMVDPAASGNTVDSVEAAATFYSEQNRVAEALALLDRIPAGSRTPAITAFRESIFVTAEIARAKQLARSGNRLAARNALIALNSRAPTSAEKTALVAGALTDIGDTQDALQLARPTAAASKKAVLDYAGLLFRAGRDAEAVAYLTQAEGSGRITAADRHELEHIKIDIATRRADQLRDHGDLAGAWDQISALLLAYPNDPTLLLSAGRIYAAAGQTSIAMRFVDAAFQQAPGDLGVIRGAIGGAIVAGDFDRARAYLAQGMRVFPNNPRLYYMEAEIARASGDNGTAVYALQIARQLDNPRAGAFEQLPPLPSHVPGTAAPPPPPPSSLPPNPFRRVQADQPRPPVMLAAATGISATDAVDAPLPSNVPLQESAVSADSDDLIVPPHASERPRRPPVAPATDAVPRPAQRAAALPSAQGADSLAGAGGGDDVSTTSTAQPRRLAQYQSLPAPTQGYQQPYYGQQPASYPQQPTFYGQQPAGYTQQPAYYGQQPAYYGQQPANYTQQPTYSSQRPGYYPQQPGYYGQQPVATMQPMQPLPPPPIPGYQPPIYGQPAAPVPQDSLESDIDRSMAAIAAEAGPTMQGGLAFRARAGEAGLSQLTEIGVPIEGTFSPFYTGTVRLQAIPTFLDAGKPALTAVTRFGNEPVLGLNPNNNFGNIPLPGSQTANGVSLNLAYAYQFFEGEIGTTPLGFRVENLVGRLALVWPPPAPVTTALSAIPLAPTSVSQPVHLVAEAVRKPITDSLLSYAGTKDPVTGLVWGGVVKTGGDLLLSYDDGDVGAYIGGGGWSIEGKSVLSNSEFEGLLGAYVRPYRVGSNAFKIGINLSYNEYDRNLSYFTFGQGGYFSPQSYLNVSVPVEYSGRSGRYTYLIGGALGVQTFNEHRSPYLPTEPGAQAALQNTFGNLAFYPSRNVTGISFNGKGQVEYQLNNGFVIGGLATIDNAQNYTEGIAKVYLRKSFGAPPSAALLPYTLPGSL